MELKCSAVRAAEADEIGMDFSQATMDMALAERGAEAAAAKDAFEGRN